MWRLSLGLFLIILVAIAGCGGGVEWFPDNNNASEPTPAAFTFPAKVCQPPSTLVESAEVKITGVTSNATVKIENGVGEYMISGGSWLQGQSYVAPASDQSLTIKVRHTTAALGTAGGSVTTLLKVGNTSGVFTSDIDRTTACP